MPSLAAYQTCDFDTGAELIGSTSPTVYTFTQSDLGTVWFACQITAHCSFVSQKIEFTVAPAPVTAQPTTQPSSSPITNAPTTLSPTKAPTPTNYPTLTPTASPQTTAPSSRPITGSPTITTTRPSSRPITGSPTKETSSSSRRRFCYSTEWNWAIVGIMLAIFIAII